MTKSSEKMALIGGSTNGVGRVVAKRLGPNWVARRETPRLRRTAGSIGYQANL